MADLYPFKQCSIVNESFVFLPLFDLIAAQPITAIIESPPPTFYYITILELERFFLQTYFRLLYKCYFAFSVNIAILKVSFDSILLVHLIFMFRFLYIKIHTQES